MTRYLRLRVRDTGRSLNYFEQRAVNSKQQPHSAQASHPAVNSSPTHHGTAIPKAHCSSVSPHPAESLSAIADICCPSCIYPDTYHPINCSRMGSQQTATSARDCANATRPCCLQPAASHRLHPPLAVRRPKKEKKKKRED